MKISRLLVFRCSVRLVYRCATVSLWFLVVAFLLVASRSHVLSCIIVVLLRHILPSPVSGYLDHHPMRSIDAICHRASTLSSVMIDSCRHDSFVHTKRCDNGMLFPYMCGWFEVDEGNGWMRWCLMLSSACGIPSLRSIFLTFHSGLLACQVGAAYGFVQKWFDPGYSHYRSSLCWLLLSLGVSWSLSFLLISLPTSWKTTMRMGAQRTCCWRLTWFCRKMSMVWHGADSPLVMPLCEQLIQVREFLTKRPLSCCGSPEFFLV